MRLTTEFRQCRERKKYEVHKTQLQGQDERYREVCETQIQKQEEKYNDIVRESNSMLLRMVQGVFEVYEDKIRERRKKN